MQCALHQLGSAEKQVQGWNSMARLPLGEKAVRGSGQEPGPARAVGWGSKGDPKYLV